MAPLSPALAAYKRGIGKEPELVTLNCYAEKTPNGMVLIGRGGLTKFVLPGSGPIRAIFQKSGLFDDDVLILSGPTLFRVTIGAMVTALPGTVPGRDRVSMDGGQDSSGNSQARIANGTGLYLTDGATVHQEDFPTAGLKEAVTSVCCHRNFWQAVHADSEQCFTLIPGDTDWLALSFITAEWKPDKLVAVATRGDQITLHGRDSLEFWTLSGTTSPPITPYGGMVYNHGTRSRDSIVNVGDALIYVDNHCQVRRTSGGAPEIISDADLAELIRQADPADLRAWAHTADGHTFYNLTIGTVATMAFDTKTEFWTRRNSKGLDAWRAHLGVDISGKVLCCDSTATNPQVWLLDPDRMDDDGDEIERVATFVLSLAEGSVPCDSLTMSCAVGEGTQTGQGADPMLGLRWSDDDAKRWTGWFWKSLGQVGQSRTRVRFNRLGQARGPKGRLFQVRCTDPVTVRFGAPILNEAP